MNPVDLASLATAMAVIIGIVNGVALLSNESNGKIVVSSFMKFVLALILGIVFGALHMFGLTVELGIVAALASSGLYKIAQVL